MAGLKNDVEERLGVPCTYVLWQYGTQENRRPEVDDVVAGAGYSGLLSAIRGSMWPGTLPILIACPDTISRSSGPSATFGVSSPGIGNTSDASSGADFQRSWAHLSMSG
ncbi:MAG: hypothetical protein HQ548_04105 [Chloroflexi bacterium]|nr:hypothetical protein [Chloroflexota bacterium]